MKKIRLCLLLLSIIACKEKENKNYNNDEVKPKKEYEIIFDIRSDQFKNFATTADSNILIGHSVIQYANWDEFLPDKNIKNRGIGGSTIETLTPVIESELKKKPKRMFIMTGINDIGMDYSQEKIKKDYLSLFTKLKKYPDTKIYFFSNLPGNSHLNKNINFANNIIKQQCNSKVKYIDLTKHFADENGFLKQKFSMDFVHLNGAGYIELSKIIKEYLDL